MALTAQRYEVILNVLVAEAFVCLVVNLKPPLRAVVGAGLAHAAVNCETL